MVFQGKKEDFLYNVVNKQAFVYLLADHLTQSGCCVKHSKVDADLVIVQNAIATAHKTRTKSTIVVASDTDILIVLYWHMTPETPSIYFSPDPRQGSKRAPRCWNMEIMRAMLGSEICDKILFVNGILGCDTMSSLYGVGKKIDLKLIHTNNVFLEQA
ncbi:hypothetical protein Hamer_G007106 [Homarus americanus]|uniref:Uncharacterized protein n=1 Tax=Homarus americanus TaxID=6706 RepID=A0A8J5JWW5_HOMAM|nr:hypothetical protein Hamer_G007106 [Homarus americanus]